MFSNKVFYCLLFSLAVVSAYKEDVRKVLKSCKNGQEVTDEELEEFVKPMIPKTYDEKCLMACAFKAYNVINVGVYDPKIALAVGQQMLKNEPEKAQKLKEVIAHCGDDVPKKMDNECELAGEIMQCLVKYEKAALGYRMANFEEIETDTEETSRLTLTPNMIISGGKLAVKMLMSNVVKGLEGVIHGVNNVLGVAVDFGFDMIKPRPTESDDY